MDLKECDADDRLGFVRKVYMILFAQLGITAGFTFIGITSTTMAAWMYDNVWLYIVLAIFGVCLQCTILCCRNVARKVPVNYILLLLFTGCEAYFVCWLCQYYTYIPQLNTFDPDGYRTVGVALAMTMGLVTAITVYAWTTKTDFTRKMGFIWVFAISFMMLGIFSIFFYSYILRMVICAIGVCLFGLYLIFDTQLILGEGRHSLSIDDYILGAMILYMDIIMIFVYLLQLVGGR